MKHILTIALCLTAFITTACAKEEVEETIEQTLDFKSGQLLKVSGLNGSIVIKTGRDDQIEMVVIKKAKANTEQEAEELLENTYIEIEPTAKGLEISTKHPEQGMLRRGRSIQVKYILTVPQIVTLDLHTTNGNIEITETEGDIGAKTSNGKIHINGAQGDIKTKTSNGKIHVGNVTGNVNAKSTNGSIRLAEIQGGITASTTNGSLRIDVVEPSNEPIQAQTTNGGIDITLPSDYQAHLEAKTTNGRISTDFPITVKGRFSGKSISGALNGGGDTRIRLQTTNGSIDIDHR
ncbi:MAG: DUF4097 family beta strand repeat protein [Candidatus Latescibacteria bacterium]|nr:DUF4097 family beta strand repeat protein [Candidatus Latescibacterota bacterium]